MKKLINKYSNTILSLISVTGVITTTFLSIKATSKAVKILEKEKPKTKLDVVKCTWKIYLPTMASGLITTCFILGTHVINNKKQASLLGAYSLLNKSYTDYKNKLKELYGEEQHQKILDEIRKEEVNLISITSSFWLPVDYLDISTSKINEVKRTFYDHYSKRYFDSTMTQVLQAEYHFNRNFMLRGYSPLNEFYEFLGISKIEVGDDVGWNMYESSIYWVDFYHWISINDKGEEIINISFEMEPEPDFMSEYL